MAKRHYHLWTGAEVRQLRQLYPSRTPAQIAKVMGLSESQVIAAGHRLKLYKTPDYIYLYVRQKGERIPWSDEQVKALKANAYRIPWEEMTAMCGHTRRACECKYSRILKSGEI